MAKSIYQRLFENWPEPRVLLEREADGELRVARANDLACDYFDQPHGALDGKRIEDFIDTDSRTHVMRAIDVCFQSRMGVTVQMIPSTRRGGVQIRSFYLNPLQDNGEVVGLDMGARLPAPSEEAVKRERDDAVTFFTSIFDASDLGIVVTDQHRRIVRVNETFCRLYGWQPMDLLGNEFTILIPETEQDIARQRHDDFLGNVYVERSRELRILRKDGSIANIIASSGVIELSGHRKFRISTVIDISYLKTIEADLRQAKNDADAANRAKSAFLANMSHELRTPLNAIIGFSDLMVAGTLGEIENPHYKSYMGDIKFSATHLLSIINDVLDMSKIEAGRMRLDEQAMDLGEVLHDVCRIMAAKAKERDLTITTRIEAGLPNLSGDERMIRQIFLNLLSNAVKFSNVGGTIAVSASLYKDGQLGVIVKDDGIGIPKDKLEEVMQPFGQVSDPRVAKGQGTGLGLPLTKAMVELHCGTLTLESDLGQGTSAITTFPASRLLKGV